MDNIKIAAVCCTFNRPALLGRLIRCFERQTIKQAELVILDDLGQYDEQQGDRWRLISVGRRFRTLGEKRNAVAALVSPDVNAYAVADDDDHYQDWWLESLAEGLQRANLVQPRVAIDFDNLGNRIYRETFRRRSPRTFAYHGCWAYRRKLFLSVGGYRAINRGDDQDLQKRMKKAKSRSMGIKGQPFYTYNRILEGLRISEIGDGDEPANQMAEGAQWVGKVPEWTDESDWEQPIPTEVHERGW